MTRKAVYLGRTLRVCIIITVQAPPVLAPRRYKPPGPATVLPPRPYLPQGRLQATPVLPPRPYQPKGRLQATPVLLRGNFDIIII